MSTILSKKEMSEEDIKLQYITPAITSNGIEARLPWRHRLQMVK